MMFCAPASIAAWYGGRNKRTQRRFVHVGDAAINIARSEGRSAPCRAAIADEVFRGRQRSVRRGEIVALQAVNEGDAQLGHEVGILAVTLVGASPANILRHRDHRGIVPVNAGGDHLLGSRAPDLLDQIGVTSRAQADVLREDGRAAQIVVSVNGIHAVNDRDAEARVKRALLEARRHLDPRLDRITIGGITAAAAQNTADSKLGHVSGREAVLLDQRHLPDLLVERHPPQKIGDAIGNRKIGVAIGFRLVTSLRAGNGDAEDQEQREDDQEPKWA